MRPTRDLTCDEAHDAAPEYALGILPPDERARVAAHLIRCPDCRHEVDDMSRLGDDLLDLVPAAEPPLGFDGRVLAAVQTPRRVRFRARAWVAAGVAAAAAAAAIGIGVASSGGSGASYQLTAALRSQGRVIGSVYTEGHPPWVWMMVHHAGVSGRVTCELIEANGSVVRLGSFDLVSGNGSWGTPEPSGGEIYGARLVTSDGQVLGTAMFSA